MRHARTICSVLFGIAIAIPGLSLANDTAKENDDAKSESFVDFALKDSAKDRAAAKDRESHKDVPVVLSESKEKFIYLDDGSNDEAKQPASERPLFIESDRQAPTGLNSQKPRKRTLSIVESPSMGGTIRPDIFSLGAEQRSGFQIGYALTEPKSPSRELGGFGVWISSEVARQAPAFGARWQALDRALEPVLNRKSYNVGLNVGYGGFAVGASLTREENGYNLGYQGVDVGVGYYGRSWFTNVQFADYRNDNNPLYYNFMGESLRAVEVGAGYSFWPGFTFSGRFKYFDYSHPLFSNRSADEQHIFSLDTKLNF